ncbi:DUF2812 domain-containing protein [Paenibacillus sp. MMS20-IR301]|uniref:DUF2812 domain-containing protein n=1 Tax=Paenibacillus sp. MMS20-IR301 TaxID=2895946 RepID=UPI0028E8AF38|nr:DUF2812 domain-containing protein [Paenibacillus sp. MMS20-IR301]WNS46478.1 DUF2812 domain-containing protein [Paenibacillus sp. MMS20-IR301]
MSQVVRKYFIDFEKEEQWLNEMSDKGLALIEYSWARYVFEESAKGEYIYRIELLEDDPQKGKSADYLQFMEETGAERVPAGKQPGSKRIYLGQRWIIFRRKASEGNFTIYSDIDSKIKHYQRIHRLWLSLAIMELIIGCFNVGLIILNNPDYIYRINFTLGVLLIILGIFFALLCVPVHRKISRLQNDKLIRE